MEKVLSIKNSLFSAKPATSTSRKRRAAVVKEKSSTKHSLIGTPDYIAP
jgi:hypothetical protein